MYQRVHNKPASSSGQRGRRDPGDAPSPGGGSIPPKPFGKPMIRPLKASRPIRPHRRSLFRSGAALRLAAALGLSGLLWGAILWASA